MGQDDHDNAPVPAQVSRGHVVGEGHDEDPVPDQVVQGPVGGEGRVEDPVCDQVVRGSVGPAQVGAARICIRPAKASSIIYAR